MIASLHGTLRAVRDEAVVVEVHGVGYLVHVSATLLDEQPQVGETIDLHTTLCVRDNDLSLYGFRTAEEQSLFELLISVSGIGPRIALAALAAFSPQILRDAIAHDDMVALTRIPGVGRKTAQRLTLDLKDKVGVAVESWAPAAVSGANVDVINALTSLGYSVAEAENALANVPDDTQELDARILTALRFLGSG